MEEDELPHRMFEYGFEPMGKKQRVNNYFNLGWIDIIKNALEDEDIETLIGSQFGNIMQMRNHTFSVKFVHYLLARQLETKKMYELLLLFAGKHIRFGISEFAFVTGLKCEEPSPTETTSMGKAKGKGKRKAQYVDNETWTLLFKHEKKPTTDWVLDKLLQGKRYEDPLTWLRLALILLVEGILCPTCSLTNIRPEVVAKLGDIDEFLNYSWGRESFLLTITSAKGRTADKLVQDSIAVQGFARGIVLVVVCCSLEIIARRGVRDRLCDEDVTPGEVLQAVLERNFAINYPGAKNLDIRGHEHIIQY